MLCVVDPVVVVADCRQAIVCAPLVRIDCGAGRGVRLDDRDERGGIASVDQQDVHEACVDIDHAEHPLPMNEVAAIVLAAAQQALIDLDD